MVEKIVVGPLEENCYIVYEEKNSVLIDPGDEAEKILSRIKSLNVDLLAIFLTHGHYDHIGAVEAIRKKTKAPVYCSEKEKELLFNPALNLSEDPPISLIPDHTFSDGDEVRVKDMEFRFMLTPGHTLGSAVIFYGDELFTGDTLFFGGYGRTDLPTGDMGEMRKSLRRLLSLEKNYNVYPGHGPLSKIRR